MGALFILTLCMIKLFILAIYRSPQGNFNTFLTNLNLICTNVLILILTLLYVETLMLTILQKVIKNSTTFYSPLILAALSIFLLE